MLNIKRRRFQSTLGDLEPLESRILLAADISSPQPAQESMDRSYSISPREFLARVSSSAKLDDSLWEQAEAAIFRPTVVGGSATGTPPDSPANRVDPNSPAGSIYNGVGSIEVNHSTGTFICTGSLIHERYVITAAHCFDLEANPDGQVDPGTTASYFLNDGGDLSTEIEVVSIINHPDFGGFMTSGANDDLALLELASPVPAGTNIFPIRRGDLVEGEVIEFVGYGQGGFGDVGFTLDPTFTTKRVGFNQADLLVVDDEGSGVNEIYLFDFDENTGTDPGLRGGTTLGNTIEATVGGGDSGAPTLVTIAGQKHLAAVTTFEFALSGITPDAGFFGSLGGGVIIDPYIPWIQSILPNEVDIELTMVESMDPVARGGGVGDFSYTLTAHNKGPGNASNVTIQELLTLPTGVSISSVDASSGTFVGSTWNLGSLPGWTSETLTIFLTVDSSTAVGTNVIGTTATLTNVVPADVDASNNVASELTSVVEGVDIQLAATESLDPAVAGGAPLVYTVTATNDSTLPATGVAIEDVLTLPAGVTVQSVVASAGSHAGSTWSLGTLGPGTSETLTVTLNVASFTGAGSDVIGATFTATSNEADNEPSNNVAALATSVVREVDLVVTGEETIDPVPAGSLSGVLTHNIVLTNEGPSNVTGAVVDLDFTLPPGVSLFFVGAINGSFTPIAAPDGRWTVNIPANRTARLIALFSVADTAANGVDVIRTKASVTGAGGATLINPQDDSTTVATSISGGSTAPDLAVEISESIDPVTAGSGAGNLTYVVTASNVGQSAATGVSIADTLTLPSGVSVVSITPSAGAYAPPGAPTGVWAIGDLAVGASETLTIVLTVDASASEADSIVHTASVASLTEDDANPSNDMAEELTAISRSVDIALSKTESAPEVTAGSGPGNLVHVVTARNLGVSHASGVIVEDLINVPAGVTVDSIQPSNGTAFVGTVWTVGDLPSGGSETLTITYTVGANAAAGIDVIRDNASLVAVNEQDANPNNDFATEATSIVTATAATADFGDAPLGYPTLLSENGPRHTLGSGLRLGALIDAESDGVHSATATGDDAKGVDDEDGVDFVTAFTPGGVAVLVVTASGTGRLDAWVDFNSDGDLTDPGEQVLTNNAVRAGQQVRFFTVPASAKEAHTLARFRLSSAGGLAPTGPAPDGEVEDYLITIGNPPAGPPASPTDLLISGKQSPAWVVDSYSLTTAGNNETPLPWQTLNTIEVPYAGTPTLTGAELVLKGTRLAPGATPPVVETTFQGFSGGVATWTFDDLPLGYYQFSVPGRAAIEFSVLPGDVWADPTNAVDFTDFAVFAGAFGTQSTEIKRADFDGDGDVGFTDLAIFSGVFATSLPTPQLSPASFRIVEQLFGDLSSLLEDDEDDEGTLLI